MPQQRKPANHQNRNNTSPKQTSSRPGNFEWQASKTPSQYVRQMNMPAFTKLSRHFINVRYGNFEATSEVYNQVTMLQSEIMRGGVGV